MLTLLVFLLAATASGDDATEVLAHALPSVPVEGRLADLGRGVGIVFTPDLSVAGNCRFYESLGFTCFDSPDWQEVLDGIRAHNRMHPERAIRTLVLETHGTNGNGLKLQTGKKPKDDRSYISVGGLQERLEADGVRYVIISACNSSRLLRPSIYRNLDPNNGDKLFLPATRGILGASELWSPERSRVLVLTPQTSNIETTLVGHVRELAPDTRKAIAAAAKERGLTPPQQFAVSDMLIQMLTRDPQLRVKRGGHVEELSAVIAPASHSERLFDRFVAHLDTIAAREAP